MSVLWTSEAAAEATGGASAAAWQASGVSIDTRSLAPGDLFVALKDQRDGHEFVADALAKGAAAALVTHKPDGVAEDAPLLMVDNVLAALEGLARAARRRTSARIVAVTGSVGKTSSKDMLRLAFSAQGRTHAAEKSYNNHWGVPLTLARMPQETDFAVIEIGMNAPGEIAPLSMLSRPHVALITTIAPVHMEAFESIRGIAAEKASIFEGVEPGGWAILNRDTERYGQLVRKARRHDLNCLRFGWAGRPEFALDRISVSPSCTSVQAKVDRKRMMFKIGAPGKHLAHNALGVLAAVQAAGADVAKAALALSGWSAAAGRGERWVIELGPRGLDGQIRLIDESYNANPASMGAALDVLAAMRPDDGEGRISRGRRIAFLGDMLELGKTSADMHADLSKRDALDSIDRVHCAGPLMRNLWDALPGNRRGEWFETSAEMAARAAKMLDAGDVAMVKGSLGSRLAPVVTAIKGMGAAKPDRIDERDT